MEILSITSSKHSLLLENLHQLTINPPLLLSRKPLTKISSLSSLHSITNLHRITIRQPMIYLFRSRHTSNINIDASIENSTI